MLVLLKYAVRWAIQVFCPDIQVRGREALQAKGPLLLVANHPDSFLDAIILGSMYPRKMHFLARADVFRHPVANVLLRFLGMLPIYRAREGAEHLHKNAGSFDASVDILSKGGAVLIFIEGLCLNKNDLLPFKKGAARILESCLAKGIPVQVQVACLAYNDFHGPGKRVAVDLSTIEELPSMKGPEDRLRFNTLVHTQMQKRQFFPNPQALPYPIWQRLLFGPCYLFWEPVVAKKTQGTVFYDSVLFAVLFFSGLALLSLSVWWFLLIFI